MRYDMPVRCNRIRGLLNSLVPFHTDTHQLRGRREPTYQQITVGRLELDKCRRIRIVEPLPVGDTNYVQELHDAKQSHSR